MSTRFWNWNCSWKLIEHFRLLSVVLDVRFTLSDIRTVHPIWYFFLAIGHMFIKNYRLIVILTNLRLHKVTGHRIWSKQMHLRIMKNPKWFRTLKYLFSRHLSTVSIQSPRIHWISRWCTYLELYMWWASTQKWTYRLKDVPGSTQHLLYEISKRVWLVCIVGTTVEQCLVEFWTILRRAVMSLCVTVHA